jgi:beta-lactamase class A
LRDDLHAREQSFALALEARDLLDLFVELSDLVAKDLVAARLGARPTLDGDLRDVHDAGRHCDRAREGDQEFFLALLT